MSVTTVRVRYAETDQMGIVHHAVYYVWFELARIEFLREAGMAYDEWEAQGFRLPVVASACRHKLPARFGEDVKVLTYLASLSGARLRFEYTVCNEGGDTLAVGSTEHACIDNDGRPIRLERLPAYERLASALSDQCQ